MDRNEAIKVVKSNHPTNNHMLNDALEFLIPELAESEDEKIRKWLINELHLAYHRAAGDREREDCLKKTIAWLERQGENNFKPKFKVGDYLVNDYCKGKVIALTDDAYLLDTEQGIPFSCEHNAHLWTIDKE